MIKTVSRAALAAASALGFMAVFGPASAGVSPNDTPTSVIHQFIDDFNKGDMAGAKAAHVDAPTIIDEPPPHLWSGSGAVDGWAQDLLKDAKASGDTDGRVRLGAVSISHVESDTAYVQIHADYLYREHHKAMVEPGGFTFALTKAGGDWKIAAWAWNGSKPHPVTPVARPATSAAAKPKT